MANPDESPALGQIKKPIVMPDSFHGGVEDEWEDWLNSFLVCASINSWNDETKCIFLAVSMKGVAQKVYFELGEDVRKKWSELTTTLGSRFRTSKQEDLCKSQFLVRCRGDGETLLDFGNDIRRLSRKAYPTMDPKIRDELARDQFIRGMRDKKLSIDLRKTLPKTLDDTIRIAVEWETIEQDVDPKGATIANAHTGAATGCSHPAVANAVSSDETSREMLSLMKELTYLLKDKRETGTKTPARMTNNFRGDQRGRRDANPRCWECGAVGHLSRDCQQKECWRCGQMGHLQGSCRNKPKQEN